MWFSPYFLFKTSEMIKQKLISKRKERGYSQEEMADKVRMSQSQYSRREKGAVRITKKEWDDMANALNADLEEIYEPHDGIYIINNENASGEYSGSQNHFHTIPGYILESMQKYMKNWKKKTPS